MTTYGGMKYNPDLHHRRSIRLRGYDYSQAGLYFVTICCDGRQHRFGTIENGEMIINEYGTIAENEWWNLAERFGQVELDVFQMMPNHIHGIIAIGTDAPIPTGTDADIDAGVGAPLAGAPIGPIGADAPIRVGQPRAGASPAPTAPMGTDAPIPTGTDAGIDAGVGAPLAGAPIRANLGDIVGAYKSLVANRCLKIYQSHGHMMGKFWQRNYWEHIIRNEQELSRIRRYIKNNPRTWESDELNGGSGNRVLEPQTEFREWFRESVATEAKDLLKKA